MRSDWRFDLFKSVVKRKKGEWPVTRVTKPEPTKGTEDWVIWAAWADRITFEEIYEQSAYRESDVVAAMRRRLKRSSFRKWRQRVAQQSIKHRKLFAEKRRGMRV